MEDYMKLLIKEGRVLDPATNTDQVMDLLIEDGKIVERGTSIDESRVLPYQIISAKGCFVMPGFIDLHVHLRDPGYTDKETVETGIRAAETGGYTTILAMPNTLPVVDNEDIVNYVQNKAKSFRSVNVMQLGAITKGQQGKELADIEKMVEAGIPAISEDGKSVMDAKIYLEAMKVAKECDIPIFAHCEDKNIIFGGVVNDDENAAREGLPGISNAVEDVIVARDIILSEGVGSKLHLCHCSTEVSVCLVEGAKKRGYQVTAEVCPHHFALTSDDRIPGDTNYKMNPPLRTKKDVDALKQGLKDGIIDAISTDHAPHSFDDKNTDMLRAPFGIIGLETAAALTYSELVLKDWLTPLQMAEKMSYNPAKIIGIDKGTLEVGKTADIVIFDPEETYEITKEDIKSKSSNTPFIGRTVTGRVVTTIVGGKVVYIK